MRCVPIVACLLTMLTASAVGQSRGVIMGKVRTPEGAAGGASVVIRGNLASVTTADSVGHFVLTDVAAGTYLLVATLEGWNAGSASASVHGGDTVSVDITLSNMQQLPGISVAATRPSSYYSDSTVGGTKFPVSQLDLPQDITVVNQAVIDDRHITAPSKLTNNVSGVIAQAPYTGVGLNEANFLFRGIPTTTYNNTLHDGFRDMGPVTRIDMSDVERVEFLKGPESVVYGAVGSLGGIANFVSKQPVAHRAGELMLSADDNGGVRSTFDMGGPLSFASGVGYRLTASAERISTFRDMSEGSNAFAIAPVVGWKPNTRLAVNFTSAYTQSRYRGDPYLPLFAGSFALPVSRFYGEPRTPFSTAQALTLQGIITYRVSSAVQLREGLGYSGSLQRDFNYDLNGIDSLGTSVLRGYGRSTEQTRDATSQTEMLATVTSDGVANRVVMGVELFAEHYSVMYTRGDSLAPIDIDHPVYGAVPSDTAPEYRFWIQQRQLGVYAQDLVELSRWMKVMLGARFDINRAGFSYQDAGEPGITPQMQSTVHHVTPRVGLVFQPGRQTSLYGSWANSFTPNMSCATCGDPASWPSEIGRQFEAGMKQQLAGGRFGATLAVYQLTKENVMILDPSDPTGMHVLIVGQMRSRGVELDASGSLAPGLDVVAAYAFTDARVTRGNESYPVGMVAGGQPRNRVSFWSTYTVHHGAIRGFALGAGVTAQESVYANWSDPVRLPGFAIVDALLAYHGRLFSVQCNFTNLTDARSYQGVSTLRVAPGAPRSLVTSIAYRF